MEPFEIPMVSLPTHSICKETQTTRGNMKNPVGNSQKRLQAAVCKHSSELTPGPSLAALVAPGLACVQAYPLYAHPLPLARLLRHGARSCNRATNWVSQVPGASGFTLGRRPHPLRSLAPHRPCPKARSRILVATEARAPMTSLPRSFRACARATAGMPS